MFIFNAVIFLTNIFFINYNFIELYEYFIIHLAIPHINYIYNLRGQNKVIDIIIYDNFNKIIVNNNYNDSEEDSDSEDINYKYQNKFPDESDTDIDINLKKNKYNNDYSKQKYNNQFLCENESDISSEIIIVDK